MQVLVDNELPTNVLSLGQDADSLRVISMGGGVIVIDQVDPDTRKAQRIVLTHTEVAAMIRAGAASVSGNVNLLILGHDAEALRVTNMGSGVVIVDQVDHDTRKTQRVVLTRTDLATILIWLS